MISRLLPGPDRLFALVLLAVVLAALSGCGAGQPGPPPDAPLVGTKMKGLPATDFRLNDEHGEEVSVATLRGKVAAIAFQYTNCPDSLPTIMEKYLIVRERLGTQAGDVVLTFVSVDPERDNVDTARAYLERENALGKVSFLTGSREILEPLWKAYYLAVNRLPIKVGSEESRRYGAYAIGHTEVIYLMDKHGRLRSLMRPDFQAEDMLHNLQVLLKEK